MTEDELRGLIDDPALRATVPAEELTDAFLDRLEDAQPRLRALITVTEGLARRDARRVQEARARGEPLPLDGMPIVVKDNTDVAGVHTTVGSRLFANRLAQEDADVVRRLRAAGAVILGKANLHELAFGGTSRNEAFGYVVNPWDPAVIPGGSSGGSAVAVAADLCLAALGTDTGGSVRLPASLCGVAGLRPTYGAVSTRGVFPVSRLLDTVGPLARSVLDLALFLDAAAGFDQRDPSSIACSLSPEELRDGMTGLRIGVLTGFFASSIDPDVAAPVQAAAETLAQLGAELVELDLPGGADAVEACGHLIKAEALALHRADLAARPELFEDGTRERLALAADLSAVDLALSISTMFEWRASVHAAFEDADLLLCPTSPVSGPPTTDADTVATTAAIAPFTHALSLAHGPALSLPCGLTTQGHPVGVQLAATPRRDRLLLRAGFAYQQTTDWHRKRAPGAGLSA